MLPLSGITFPPTSAQAQPVVTPSSKRIPSSSKSIDLAQGLSNVTPLLSATSTSLLISTAKATNGDAKALLESSISIEIKNGSLLSILDNVLNAAGKDCTIECRKVRSFKLSGGLKNVKVASVLDSIAKLGGARLYVFPSKVLISAPEFLSEKEKGEARLYGILLSNNDLTTANSKLTDLKDVIAIANTKISVNIQGQPIADALVSVYRASKERLSAEYRSPKESGTNSGVQPEFTLSLQNINFGDALSILANTTGTEVFLLPGKFLICAPDSLTPEERKVVISAFKPNSTNITFDNLSALGS